MPFQVTDFETKRQQMTAFSANRAPELANSPVDFMGEQIGAQAQIAQSLDQSVGLAAADAVPTSETSSTGLDIWATAIGLDDGKGQGTYGRKGATAASGATGQITGTGGTLIPAGTQAIGPGGVLVKLRTNVVTSGTAPGTGQVIGTFDVEPTSASSLGPIGNLSAGAVLNWIGPPSGIDPTVTLITPMQILGVDRESDPDLLFRIQERMQLPPKGGAPQDYGTWVENAKNSLGQPLQTKVFAWRYPNYDGDGCPVVVITLPGSGKGRIPPASILAEAANYVNGSIAQEGQKPISHSFRTLAPFMPDSRQLIVRARVVPSKAIYNFDWKRGTTLYSLSSVTAGPPVVLRLNTLAPLDLKAAIDAGTRPRIYIDTRDPVSGLPTGFPIPVQVKVIAWKDMGTQTLLTLENPLPPGWTLPSGSEEVFAGGPLVDAVAQSILSKVDSLGPSKASGLADPNQFFFWDDILSISGISTAIETTLDTDGLTPFVSRVIAGSISIAIGTNSPINQDVAATDTTISGPELLYAGRILITD